MAHKPTKPTDAPRPPGRPLLGRPPLHDEPHRSVTLSLPTALHEALRAESRRTGTPMSRIVADAVRKALEEAGDRRRRELSGEMVDDE